MDFSIFNGDLRSRHNSAPANGTTFSTSVDVHPNLGPDTVASSNGDSVALRQGSNDDESTPLLMNSEVIKINALQQRKILATLIIAKKKSEPLTAGTFGRHYHHEKLHSFDGKSALYTFSINRRDADVFITDTSKMVKIELSESNSAYNKTHKDDPYHYYTIASIDDALEELGSPVSKSRGDGKDISESSSVVQKMLHPDLEDYSTMSYENVPTDLLPNSVKPYAEAYYEAQKRLSPA